MNFFDKYVNCYIHVHAMSYIVPACYSLAQNCDPATYYVRCMSNRCDPCYFFSKSDTSFLELTGTRVAESPFCLSESSLISSLLLESSCFPDELGDVAPTIWTVKLPPAEIMPSFFISKIHATLWLLCYQIILFTGLSLSYVVISPYQIRMHKKHYINFN